MASQVASTDGAIGYFELSFAKSGKIPTVRLDTGAPEPVAVSAETASAGIAAGHVAGTGKDMTVKFDYKTKAAGAYPIVLVTYEIVCDKGTPADVLPALKSFLTHTAGAEGQKDLSRIHYAPCRKRWPAGSAKSSALCPDRGGVTFRRRAIRRFPGQRPGREEYAAGENKCSDSQVCCQVPPAPAWASRMTESRSRWRRW